MRRLIRWASLALVVASIAGMSVPLALAGHVGDVATLMNTSLVSFLVFCLAGGIAASID